jgi:hypothetical protein
MRSLTSVHVTRTRCWVKNSLTWAGRFLLLALQATWR